MSDVTFGTKETPALSGKEAVVTDPVITTVDGVTSVQLTEEQAEAYKAFIEEQKAAPKKEETKPEWLGDFETPEDLAKAYKEARTKISEGVKPKTEEEKAAEVKATADAEAAAKTKGVDLDKYVLEFGVNQSITAESYAELAEKGITKETVDNYIAGQNARADDANAVLYEVVGGEENYDNLLEWGRVNIPEASRNAYDRLLNAGDFEAAGLALRGFVQQYTEAEGSTPGTVNALAQSKTDASAEPFPTKTDMVAAINDPRYKNGDRAYVASVEKRILATAAASVI